MWRRGSGSGPPWGLGLGGPFVLLALGAVARRIALRLARRTRFQWDYHMVEAFYAPGRPLLGLATFSAAVRALHLAVPAQEVLDHLLRISAVVLFTWAGVRGVRFASEVLVVAVLQGRRRRGGPSPSDSRLWSSSGWPTSWWWWLAGALVRLQFRWPPRGGDLAARLGRSGRHRDWPRRPAVHRDAPRRAPDLADAARACRGRRRDRGRMGHHRGDNAHLCRREDLLDLRRLVVPITEYSRRAVPELDALWLGHPRDGLSVRGLPSPGGRGPPGAGTVRQGPFASGTGRW